MSASRQLRAITTSYRTLSARNVTQRCVSPARPSFLGSQQQSAWFVSSSVSPLQSQSRTFSASALARDEGACESVHVSMYGTCEANVLVCSRYVALPATPGRDQVRKGSDERGSTRVFASVQGRKDMECGWSYVLIDMLVSTSLHVD